MGAGPGDPDLISIKAVKVLGDADVILYDALVNTNLLKYASGKALKVFVGKRANRHAYTQEQINSLIVEHALNYGHVVRLKGGDPFIFARGHEEVEYAETFNIEVEVVPGISSINVPGLQNIPLTKRGVSESFWVVTGTTRSGRVSKDLYLAAQSSATVVILMGLNKLKKIVNLFTDVGKEDLPVAIIQNGSLPDQKTVYGTIKNIAEIAQKEKIGAPAIIIIGKVVSLHPNLVLEYVTNHEYNK